MRERWKQWGNLAVDVLLILVVGFGLIRLWPVPQDDAHTQALAAFQAKADTALQKTDSLAQRVADREAQILDLQAQLDRLRRKPPDTAAVRRLRQHTDSLYAELGDSLMTVADSVIPKQQRVILGQDTVIRWQQQVIRLQDTVLQVKDQVVADLKTSNDILRRTLEQVPAPKPPRKRWLGFIPVPTRTEAAVGGVLTGLAAGAVLLR